MTNIHFPVDGQGTQLLQKQNKSDKDAFHVDAVSPENKDKQKSSDQFPGKSDHKQTDENQALTKKQQHTTPQETDRKKLSRRTERRQKSRRQENKSVLLNTRSEQDRRKSSGQRREDLKKSTSQFGIDTKA